MLVYPTISIVFLVGKAKTLSLLKKIKEENENFGDILMMDFEDSYNNLTIKTMMTLKFHLMDQWLQIPKYLFKVDDDSYVNIPSLYKLAFNSSISSKKDLLTGYALMGSKKGPVKVWRVSKKDRNKNYTGFN